MSTWLPRQRRSVRQDSEQERQRENALAESVADAAAEIRRIKEGLAGLSAELGLLRAHTDRLAELHAHDADAPARMRVLEPVLEPARVIGHVTAAVADATLIEHPVPHLLISNVFPGDVYRAVVDAIPSTVFFDLDAAGRRELALPPVLAPLHSIVAWTFVTSVVRRALGRALVTRFETSLRDLARDVGQGGAALAASRGRIVLRRPGDRIPDVRRPGQVLTTVLPLEREPESAVCSTVSLDSETDRARLAPAAASPQPASAMLPLRGNSALSFLSVAGTAILSDESPEISAYEFAVGFTHPGSAP